jgi:LemA protein
MAFPLLLPYNPPHQAGSRSLPKWLGCKSEELDEDLPSPSTGNFNRERCPMLATLALLALSETLIGLFVILGVVLVLALILGGMYNSLVSRRVEAENSWSQIDVQLKRRYDLIPNLVETVKGYAKHESETLERVIQARNMAMNAKSVGEQAQAENQLTGALKTVFALSESYPDLKANENFKSLQEELSSTENRIGFARQHYNDSVANYNTTLQRFPTNIVGNMFGFRTKEFFTIDESERAAVKQAPKVQF